MKAAIIRFDAQVTDGITRLFPARLHRFFLLVTSIGDPIATMLIAFVLLVASVRYNETLLIAAAVIPITLIVGTILKISFERARPQTIYAANMKIKTFSFPSGHSSGSFVAYGILAYLAPTLLAYPLGLVLLAVLITLIFLIGISRVYLGAHFPSDVIAGWMLGAAMLVTLTICTEVIT